MNHRIAILLTKDVYYNGDDYSDTRAIADSITDWEIVSDEEFKLLTRAAQVQMNYVILEQPLVPVEFIKMTVAGEIARAKEAEVKAASERQSRADKALAKKLKNEMKDKDSKIALYKKLQEELGEDINK